MATEEKDTDLFARVEDGKIIEFPVYRIHIVNRAHPFSWYTPVVESEKPTVPDYYKLVQTLTVHADYIAADYTVIALTLAEMLVSIQVRSLFPVPGEEVKAPSIDDLDPSLVTYLKNMVADYAHDKLNAFAQTKRYDSIENLISYRGDSNTTLATEAERGFLLRSQTWTALFDYFENITNKKVEVPTSLNNIDAVLPALTWE